MREEEEEEREERDRAREGGLLRTSVLNTNVLAVLYSTRKMIGKGIS